MGKYVLNHGGLGLAIGEEYEDGGKKRRRVVHVRPSDDRSKPTIVEMDDKEAAKINGHDWDHKEKKAVPRDTQLLHGATHDGDCLILLAEWDAENAAAQAAAAAKAKVLTEHAVKKTDDKPKGGAK